MAITLMSAAPLDGEELLSLDDAKKHLRVDDDDDDALIEAFRDAAIDWVERYTAKALVKREFVWTASAFATPLRLTIEPIVTVDAVTYLSARGAEMIAVPVGLDVSGRDLRPIGDVWPQAIDGDGAVRVVLTAGYDADAVPAALKAAVMMLLGHLYRNREAVVIGVTAIEAPMGVTMLCAAYRTPVLG